MNFSKNHKLRRFLSLTLVLVMMTMLFAGCTQETPAPETESSLNLNLPESTDSITSEPTATATETEPPVVNENTGTVTSVLNIRSSPSTEATVVGTLYAGDKIEVSRREVVTGIDWAYIIAPEAGWVVMEFIEMDIPSQQPPHSDSSTPAGMAKPEEDTNSNSGDTSTTNIKAVVNANGLNIRSEASTSGKVQGAYNKGDVITILETKGEWGRTNKGWIKLEYVNTNSTSIGSTNKDSEKDNNKVNSNITGNGSTTVILKGVVKVTDLNLRSEGSTNGTRLGNLTFGDRVEIMEKSGNWGRTKDGWVCLDYIYQDGTTGSKTASGIITADELNIRSGPGKGYGTVGSYKEGDSVTILEQFTYNGTTWGCTNQGWIAMDYVKTSNTDTSINNTQTGTVITNGLNIRNGAGTDYPTVGSLNYGDRVTILEQKKIDDTTWGRISQGWISLDFVSLD